MRTRFFRTYLLDRDQPWWHNRWVCWWGRKPKPRQTEKGVVPDDHPHTLRMEWRLFSRSNNASVSVKVGAEDGREVTFAIGIPWLLSLYVTHSVGPWLTDRVLPWYQSNDEIGWRLDREVWIYWHWWRVNVHLWVHPLDNDYGDYGKTPMPSWRSFSFSVNPLDLLGTPRCTRETLEPSHRVFVPLPEGEYDAQLKVERLTWTRKLWPWWPLKKQRTYRDIECDDGIPFSGKGENSWDCGEDGLFATGFDVTVADTDEKAVCLFAADVLETRRKRGDSGRWPESPRDRAARLATIRAERERERAESTSGEEPQ